MMAAKAAVRGQVKVKSGFLAAGGRRRVQRRMRRLGVRIGAALLLASAAGCASMSLDVGYYWQSITGHLTVMREARPIDELIADPSTTEALRARLAAVNAIRGFASRSLGLPDNGSYTRYADLKRPSVLWNVFATPELSLQLEQWCFPVAGCISYRGYYAKATADAYAQTLRARGLDVQVAGVTAYSTLGWFDDPVLNTFIGYPEGELARLLFHELAHQVVYVKGDTRFNESFATAVEQAGVERWLAERNSETLTRGYREYDGRRRDFVALLKRHRDVLEAAYRNGADEDERRRAKTRVFAALQHDYLALKQSWGGYSGYDRWFGQGVTNAHLAAVATYTDLVPGFLRLLAEQGGDLRRFYAACRELALLPKDERDRLLGAPSAEMQAGDSAPAGARASGTRFQSPSSPGT